jgi:exosortase K
MKVKLGVLVLVALMAYALKRHYADASTEALSWILMPTAYLVSAVTGVVFAAVPGEGYFSAERMFLIEKACAGINFMIAAFAMVAFALLHRVRSFRDGATVLAASLMASYLAAVIVNTVRIVIALWLAANPPTLASLTAADIHRLEGIVVYFGGLLLLYELVRRVDGGAVVAKYAVPLGCYYLVTLLVPLANGAAHSGEAFFTHAIVVLVIPPLVILVASGAVRLANELARPAVQSFYIDGTDEPARRVRCGGLAAVVRATGDRTGSRRRSQSRTISGR